MFKHLGSTLDVGVSSSGAVCVDLLLRFQVPSLTRPVWGLWSLGPLRAPAPLSTVQAPRSLYFLTSWRFFSLQLPELVSVPRARTCSRWTLCTGDGLTKT